MSASNNSSPVRGAKSTNYPGAPHMGGMVQSFAGNLNFEINNNYSNKMGFTQDNMQRQYFNYYDAEG
jgi:hypothetical protein